MASPILFFGLLAFVFIAASASDPSPLQDFCVADTNSQVLLNGLACKDPKIVEANDFSSSGLHIAGNTSNSLGNHRTRGINPPQTHPHATKILTVLEGSLEVGFVTSNPQNRLITKVLQKGDVFVFAIGLVHYQRNVGNESAIVIAALSSQNPGVITIANAVFGSKPQIPNEILVKALQVDNDVVNYIRSKF
ncbi:hypothetical protein ACB094_05G143700 [Castanea mollissima]